MTKKAQEPQNENYYDDCPQHIFSPDSLSINLDGLDEPRLS
jgi:hypothetical protein